MTIRARSLLGLAFSLAIATSCRRESPPKPFSAAFPAYSATSRFAVVGDTQTTPLLELRESNDAERRKLVRALAAERPSFVAFDGDLVDDGSNAREWSDFDELMSPLRDAAIPAIAAFGNHEYQTSRAGEKQLFARFPVMENRHFYSLDRGPLRLLVLDSNVAVLSAEEWAAQRRFYDETLARSDADPGVRGVLVILHHEPFTNSTLTEDEGHVQRDFVPQLLAGKKTLAMLSGHVHSYERFEKQGKTFVVSGGGGGPRVTLQTGSARRHNDDLYAGPPLRDVHFVMYTIGENGLTAEVRGIPKGGNTFSTMDRFSLLFPP